MRKLSIVFAVAGISLLAACNSKSESSEEVITDTTVTTEVSPQGVEVDTTVTTETVPAQESTTAGQKLDTAVKDVKNAAHTVKEDVKSAAHDVKEGTKAAAHDVKEAAQKGARKVEQAAKDVREDLKK